MFDCVWLRLQKGGSDQFKRVKKGPVRVVVVILYVAAIPGNGRQKALLGKWKLKLMFYCVRKSHKTQNGNKKQMFSLNVRRELGGHFIK